VLRVIFLVCHNLTITGTGKVQTVKLRISSIKLCAMSHVHKDFRLKWIIINLKHVQCPVCQYVHSTIYFYQASDRQWHIFIFMPCIEKKKVKLILNLKTSEFCLSIMQLATHHVTYCLFLQFNKYTSQPHRAFHHTAVKCCPTLRLFLAHSSTSRFNSLAL
jgi:hypothetical protein